MVNRTVKSVTIKSDIKHIIEKERISIREFARRVDHSFETVRKLYHDEMERFPRTLIAKIIEEFNVPLESFLIVVVEEVEVTEKAPIESKPKPSEKSFKNVFDLQVGDSILCKRTKQIEKVKSVSETVGGRFDLTTNYNTLTSDEVKEGYMLHLRGFKFLDYSSGAVVESDYVPY